MPLASQAQGEGGGTNSLPLNACTEGTVHPTVKLTGEGQGHEDGLDAAAGLEAKDRAAVVHQVELHVAAGR